MTASLSLAVLAIRKVVVLQHPPARSFKIVVLSRSHAPEEAAEPAQAERQGEWKQDHDDVQDGVPSADAPVVWPVRNALSVTTSEEPDMAAAATSGVAKPAIATGTATML